eukprot:4589268-Alexandrium_andersonii.AAC.1
MLSSALSVSTWEWRGHGQCESFTHRSPRRTGVARVQERLRMEKQATRRACVNPAFASEAGTGSRLPRFWKKGQRPSPSARLRRAARTTSKARANSCSHSGRTSRPCSEHHFLPSEPPMSRCRRSFASAT